MSKYISIICFKNLIEEIDISKYTQQEYIQIVEAIYKSLKEQE